MIVPLWEYKPVRSQRNPPKFYKAPRYRIALVREAEVEVQAPTKFKNARDAFTLAQALTGDFDREAFFALFLDSKNKLIGINMISLGDLSTSIVHPREVYKAGVLLNAAAVIFLHNHPSGDPTPSNDDARVTKRLVQAGAILGIRVLDHVIAGEYDYYSFADSGVLEP